MWGDPGELRRTQHNVLPIPAEVLPKLTASVPASSGAAPKPHPLAGMSNIRDGDTTYCVRCCMWRDEAAPPGCWRRVTGSSRVKMHHCSTCQRCVAYFDHHCGVLGRCIAGTWKSGNIMAFWTLILVGQVGAIVMVGAVVVAVVTQSLAALAGLQPAANATSG